ncbi:hypothetical protein BC826DRAFT_1107507 [Russula brevipes]|nr:hypothetical protein BC826DRAFT_1107507 [Russula brevipes]
MPVPFALEQQVAIAAVRRACALTAMVFNKLVVGETLVKDDKSPVTGSPKSSSSSSSSLKNKNKKVADYAAQAVINTILSHAFPDDPIVGEEDAAELRAPEGEALRTRVVELADDVLAQPPFSPLPLRLLLFLPSLVEERGQRGITPAGVLDLLLGLSFAPPTPIRIIHGDVHLCTGIRDGLGMWTLDPIDGTKGFLRGGQYAVCLALLVDARVELGIIGCPNLPSTGTGTTPGDRGALFVAVRGHGALQLPLLPGPSAITTRLSMPRLALHELSFLESVEKAHAALDTHARVASRVGVRAPPVRMDSQAKYAALARGDGGGGVYLRLPVVGRLYQGKIWDHAPGSLLVEEAGGVVSDSHGLPLDFGLGRTLSTNYGVVAAGKEVHGQVIAAVQAVLAEATQGEDLESQV